MPTYDYVCKSCEKQFSVTTTISEHARQPTPCPKCKSDSVERVFGAFYAKTVKKS